MMYSWSFKISSMFMKLEVEGKLKFISVISAIKVNNAIIVFNLFTFIISLGIILEIIIKIIKTPPRNNITIRRGVNVMDDFCHNIVDQIIIIIINFRQIIMGFFLLCIDVMII